VIVRAPGAPASPSSERECWIRRNGAVSRVGAAANCDSTSMPMHSTAAWLAGGAELVACDEGGNLGVPPSDGFLSFSHAPAVRDETEETPQEDDNNHVVQGLPHQRPKD
jgi:hypothetical protein